VSATSVLATEALAPSFPYLPALVLLPFVGTLLIALVPKGRPDMHRLIAIVTSVTVFALSVALLVAFKPGENAYQFIVSQTWVSALDIKFYLGVDGISLFLVVLTGLMFPIALFAAKPQHDEKGYYLWITLLQAGCMGVFLSLDLFLFFLMFELTLVPLYFLIGRWGHGRRVYAATKFFLFTMAGSALMLVAIVALATMAHAGDNGGVSFDLLKVVASGSVSRNAARWIFLGFAVAFAVKTPVFPFHTWLPDAHTEAPTAGSVDLASVLLKLGAYGYLRFGLLLFPEASVWFAPVMLTLGTIGIVYGGIVAAMQRNLKRLIAYSSVAHMGFAIIGIFALNVQGLEGAILVMVNHGIITGALFILLGYIYTRRHTFEIAKLKGLQKPAPIFAAVFTFVMLAAIGLPGLSGFVGEFLSLIGVYLAHRWWALVAATGVIFAALYLLWAYQRTFHGEPDDDNKHFPEMKLSEKLVLAPLLALIVFLGVYPKPVLDRIEPSVKVLVEHVQRANPGLAPADTQAGSDIDPAKVLEGEQVKLENQAGEKSKVDGGSATTVPETGGAGR